jgi:hypothetical protein
MKAQYVYIKRGPAASSLSPLYTGPYKVVERGQKYFRLDVGGRSEAVSVDRLKPHLGDSPLQPAQPPRRGRPPAADFSATTGVGGRGRPPEWGLLLGGGGSVEDRKSSSSIVVCTRDKLCVKSAKVFRNIFS